jgi:penicillin-binding protein 1C
VFKSPKINKRYLFLTLLLFAAVAFWRMPPEPLFDDPSSAVLLDRHGQLLGARIADDQQWRFPADGVVSDKFRTALIHYEDKRFFRHPGVDPLALARALRQNVEGGRVVSGASTLTMQLARLVRGNRSRTYSEKFMEMVLALRLEAGYSKDEIFALYAAHAPFGGNVVGVEAAAWRYFGRGPEDLTWAEACTLAVLPNSPAIIHPGRNRDELQQKRDALIAALLADGTIDATTAELARMEPLPTAPTPLPQLAPHLIDTLRATAPGDHRYRSTLDAALQTRVQALVTDHSANMAQQEINNAAALVIDNRTFEVLAYVGNSRNEVGANGYAVDIVRSPRSTGSVLKPLLFAAMLQSGDILPATLVPDIPSNFRGYRPENFDREYRGAVPADEALIRSLNVPAVRMLQRYGVQRFYDLLRQAGVSTLTRPPDDYGLTLILGGAEGSLWEMSALYANLAWLAQSGARVGDVNYRQPVVLLGQESGTNRRNDLSAAAAWLTLNALLEVARPGIEGQWRQFVGTRKVGWKTGTSFGFRDGWAIGTTPRYTVGVWVGNASGEGRPGLTGFTAAAPLLFQIFNQLEETEWFEPPIQQLRRVEVCRDDGYLADGNCETDIQLAPLDSHFEQMTPYHQLVHLDAAGKWRVHGKCEEVSRMTHRAWFILPPGQEYFYRRAHSEYRMLPAYRRDCVAGLGEDAANPLDILYPTEGARIYIPVDLNGELSSVVFEAVHRDRAAPIYWHLDDAYLGETKTFHQRALQIAPGFHKLTLVDVAGNRMERNFEVLAKAQE